MIEGALFIAIAQVLSMLKLWEMPWGGSVTLALVPILLFAVRWGVGPGLAGLWHGKRGDVYVGTLIGGFARFLVHYVVGATVWAEYMPEEFFGMSMHSPWFYSLLYNLAYMLPNIVICLVVFVLLDQPLKKYIRGEDLQK